MAIVDKKVVLEMAQAARIALSDEEVERFQREFASILAYADALRSIDVEGVEPTVRGAELANVLRDDASRPSLPKEDVLQGAPHVQDGHFRVPKILE